MSDQTSMVTRQVTVHRVAALSSSVCVCIPMRESEEISTDKCLLSAWRRGKLTGMFNLTTLEQLEACMDFCYQEGSEHDDADIKKLLTFASVPAPKDTPCSKALQDQLQSLQKQVKTLQAKVMSQQDQIAKLAAESLIKGEVKSKKPPPKVPSPQEAALTKLKLENQTLKSENKALKSKLAQQGHFDPVADTPTTTPKELDPKSVLPTSMSDSESQTSLEELPTDQTELVQELQAQIKELKSDLKSERKTVRQLVMEDRKRLHGSTADGKPILRPSIALSHKSTQTTNSLPLWDEPGADYSPGEGGTDSMVNGLQSRIDELQEKLRAEHKTVKYLVGELHELRAVISQHQQQQQLTGTWQPSLTDVLNHKLLVSYYQNHTTSTSTSPPEEPHNEDTQEDTYTTHTQALCTEIVNSVLDSKSESS
ncbi:hypothetical protein Pelo_16815 [Pelomyxa schiedti]|nr:hypothetical protein Pelo_16815 [Pelomyxa schiedti]